MKRIGILLCLLLILCTGCHKKDKVAKPELTKEQVTNVKNVDVKVIRYEQALFSLNVNKLEDGIAQLYGKYPSSLIEKDSWKNKEMMEGLKGYLKDPTVKELYKEVNKQFPNLDNLNKELNNACKIYLEHFPNDSIPTFYTIVPGMNFSIPSVFGDNENNLFICLDMYLGKDYKYYAYAGMPKFIAARCDKKYIASDCFLQGLCYKHLPDKTLLTVLDNMIDEGKKLFFTQTMFPEKQPQDIIKYDEDQYKWAEAHQAAVWQYLIEKNILYSKDEDKIRRMVDETPFTHDFGNESPGRMGSYIGWKIVQSYMKNHPGTTLEALMKDSNAQAILNDSGYKPAYHK